MAIPNNYIDKITKGNDSRMISPAADMVRVDNENFEGTDLDGVLDEIAESISGAGGEAVHSVTVETPEDGTVDINVDDDTYTINLNHTHEGMAKLVVSEESDLPATLAADTIYGVEDSGEISMLYVGGIPFYGGGGGSTSEPILRQPADDSTIDVGTIESGQSSVTKTITVKGKNLTQALTVAVTGTGYSVNKQTISAADANVGTTLVITCTNTADNAAGTLSIASSEVSHDCGLIANYVDYADIGGVKLTGSQWLQTDYYPNANTELSLKVKFTANSNSHSTASTVGKYLLHCTNNAGDNMKFTLYNANANAKDGAQDLIFINESSLSFDGHNQILALATAASSFSSDFLSDNTVISYTKQSSNGLLKFTPGNGGTAKSVTTSLKTSAMEAPMKIGYNGSKIYSMFDLTIRELTITEAGTTVRHWVPKTRNGVPGLYDTVNNKFMGSATSTALVIVS